MAKLSYNEGFTFLDLMVVLTMMSVCTLLVLPFYKQPEFSRYTFANEYLLKQSECIRMGTRDDFDFAGRAEYTYTIHFNELGNVRQAQTIYFTDGKRIVSQLGGGRIEFK